LVFGHNALQQAAQAALVAIARGADGVGNRG
jgi:hypothetical protein